MATRLPTFFWPLLACAALTPVAPVGAAPLDARFELVREVPWSATGLAETVASAGGGLLLTDTAKVKNREIPSLAQGPDGRLWFFTKSQLGVAAEGGYTPVSLTAFDAAVQAVAPLAEGAVVLGSRGRENVLARLNPDGTAAWRKTGPLDPAAADPTALRGILRRLTVDQDGSVYLYATRQAGLVAQVAPADGAIRTVLTVEGFQSAAAWVVGGTLYRAAGAEGADHTWVARPIAGGADTVVQPAAGLGRALPGAVALPDGGALVMPRASVVRMAADGKAVGELALAGAVRGADGKLYVAIEEGGALWVTGWSGGKPGAATKLEGIEGHARLAAVTAEGFAVVAGRSMMEAGTLIRFDASGKKTGETPLDGQAEMLLALEGGVDLGRMVAGPPGVVFLPGADARGAYVVRVSLP